MKKTLILSSFLAFCFVSAQAEILKGESSLQGSQAQTEAFLKPTPKPGNLLEQRLDVWMTMPGSAVPIKEYQVEMTKKLHVIIVSDDFKTFIHVHPPFAPNGHFVITQAFPAAGTYFLYADALPNGLNHQVFRFKLDVGHASSPSARDLPTTGMGVQTGPYEVDLSSVRLHSHKMEMVSIQVLKGGKPARDLHPYLGAAAHAVFLNAGDLSYVHVHPTSGTAMSMPMDMSKPMAELPEGAAVSDQMMLHVALWEPGTYRLWLQFRGADDKLYVAEFTILAS